MTFTPAPACPCRSPAVFGHTDCELGPPWVIEAERRRAAMAAEDEQRRRRFSWAWARRAGADAVPGDLYEPPS